MHLVKNEQAAIIFNPDGSLELCVPPHEAGDIVPDHVLLAAQVMLDLNGDTESNMEIIKQLGLELEQNDGDEIDSESAETVEESRQRQRPN